MLSRKSKKDTILPKRPEPPSVQQIKEDIEIATSDDIIFRLQQEFYKDKDSPERSPGGAPLLMSESFCMEDRSPDVPRPVNPSSLTTPKPMSMEVLADNEGEAEDSPDVETIYQQALQFIRVTEELKKAPERLQKQCEHLQELGQALTTSIDELRLKSQAVLQRELTNNEHSPQKT